MEGMLVESLDGSVIEMATFTATEGEPLPLSKLDNELITVCGYTLFYSRADPSKIIGVDFRVGGNSSSDDGVFLKFSIYAKNDFLISFEKCKKSEVEIEPVTMRFMYFQDDFSVIADIPEIQQYDENIHFYFGPKIINADARSIILKENVTPAIKINQVHENKNDTMTKLADQWAEF